MLFTWSEEDPSNTKILEGGTTFRWVEMQNDREGMKTGERQKQKCNMGSSVLFIGVNNYILAEFSQL